MPNIKSAKKRVLVNAKKTEQNKAIRSLVKTEMKKIDALIKENKLEEAKASLAVAFKTIDSACSKNIFHANNASNKKAKLAKKVDVAIKANGVVENVEKVEEVVAPEVAPVATEEVATPAKKPATRKPRAKKVEAAE